MFVCSTVLMARYWCVCVCAVYVCIKVCAHVCVFKGLDGKVMMCTACMHVLVKVLKRARFRFHLLRLKSEGLNSLDLNS